MQTARSLASSEYLDDFLLVVCLAPFSQRLEPPGKSGWFNQLQAIAVVYMAVKPLTEKLALGIKV